MPKRETKNYRNFALIKNLPNGSEIVILIKFFFLKAQKMDPVPIQNCSPTVMFRGTPCIISTKQGNLRMKESLKEKL